MTPLVEPFGAPKSLVFCGAQSHRPLEHLLLISHALHADALPTSTKPKTRLLGIDGAVRP
ncbi:hypothetical protein [Lentzea sp. NEAU-D7]|uniref:hypothetical protein n=1 Tax=Lentzea sp. NEAU-D7 TaxID=2994667 RepID=UPI00224B8CA0|nr:hypothetical protein [Lentzea sp. NEAU-D7]